MRRPFMAFGAYLGGIETTLGQDLCSRSAKFGAYLGGIETLVDLLEALSPEYGLEPT